VKHAYILFNYSPMNHNDFIRFCFHCIRNSNELFMPIVGSSRKRLILARDEAIRSRHRKVFVAIAL